ncbi:hypothetical protein COCNU_scaffold001198G000100 [Cocos nucifera]|nr:hypothetical protein [Cocos nucifera]
MLVVSSSSNLGSQEVPATEPDRSHPSESVLLRPVSAAALTDWCAFLLSGAVARDGATASRRLESEEKRRP